MSQSQIYLCRRSTKFSTRGSHGVKWCVSQPLCHPEQLSSLRLLLSQVCNHIEALLYSGKTPSTLDFEAAQAAQSQTVQAYEAQTRVAACVLSLFLTTADNFILFEQRVDSLAPSIIWPTVGCTHLVDSIARSPRTCFSCRCISRVCRFKAQQARRDGVSTPHESFQHLPIRSRWFSTGQSEMGNLCRCQPSL